MLSVWTRYLRTSCSQIWDANRWRPTQRATQWSRRNHCDDKTVFGIPEKVIKNDVREKRSFGTIREGHRKMLANWQKMVRKKTRWDFWDNKIARDPRKVWKYCLVLVRKKLHRDFWDRKIARGQRKMCKNWQKFGEEENVGERMGIIKEEEVSGRDDKNWWGRSSGEHFEKKNRKRQVKLSYTP